MRDRERRRMWLAGAVTVALATWGAAPAVAATKLDSFAGSCSIQGTNYFSPPATFSQQPLALDYPATGTCSGTLNGRDVSNAPVTVHNTGRSSGSCLHAETTGPGRGAITFADGTTIRYSFEFVFVFSEGTITYSGERSGSALGHGTFLTQRTPPDTTAKCAGAGASEIPLDISLSTQSPLVSERSGTGGTPSGKGGTPPSGSHAAPRNCTSRAGRRGRSVRRKGGRGGRGGCGRSSAGRSRR